MGTKTKPSAWDCYANLLDDEPYFVLMGRDRYGASTVRMWADQRENELRASDATCTAAEVFREIDQIAEARRVADEMDQFRADQALSAAGARRLGATLTCGCWWADPPGAVEQGYAADCPFHGDVTIATVNVRGPGGDDGVFEFVRADGSGHR